MERPAGLCGLWALLLCAGGGAAPNEILPPVTNLSVSVENLCTIIWTWNSPEGVRPNCSLWYYSYFGNHQDKKITLDSRRLEEVPLNEDICLHVISQCGTNESEKTLKGEKKCISPPEGDPRSAVTDLRCIWFNLTTMKCSWLPGNTTRANTTYLLYYWHKYLTTPLQCENSYREGHRLGCSFNLTDSRLRHSSIQVMVKDNGGKIRPSFSVVALSSHVVPAHPDIIHLSFKNSNLLVEWKKPGDFLCECLSSQLEVNNSHLSSTLYTTEETKCQNPEKRSQFKITTDLDTSTTVRIRVRTNKYCYEDSNLWSEWSEKGSLGQKTNSTFYITILLIIPVLVAFAIIVLLFYLKRLKIIIFPPIPDPGKIFKEMFGDQNDDTLHWRKYDIYDKQTKEETDSVVLIENLKRGSQ
ncbi:interleukin-13 receptor subunit alpha-1 isoform X1 [Tenrec ecaudatus]|uniref:interleukin-13 receptor subunit alpha-1 isoform X1 n=1 Tax=Tenrec ecaudatus TaxID=94439 RepID=UPI003F59C293